MNQFAPIRSARHLTGAQKAAILFLCLGEESGGALMQQLEDAEIRYITSAISSFGEVDADVVEEIMDEFLHMVGEARGVSGSVDAARGLLSEFLPAERVDEILEEIGGNRFGNVWTELGKLDEKLLAEFLHKEHNQTVAVVLSRINADTSAKVLPLMGPERSVNLIERMMDMDNLPVEILQNIENSLRNEVLAKANRDSDAKIEKHLVSMFNKLDKTVFSGLAAELEKKSPDRFKSIKQKMFVFDDLSKFPPPMLAKIMREVPPKSMPLAMRGASKEIREHFLSSLPARSRDMLEDEMKSMGPVKSRDVKTAQFELVEAATKLIASGDVELPSDDEEDMM